MRIDSEKIDQLIQFALLVAGEEDHFTDRSLGPIHLLKYVYLADYYFALRNQGSTYTGIDWKFFNFGPWSPEVHDRVEPALKAIMAEKFTGQSDYNDNDYTRWSLNDENRLRIISTNIPPAIRVKLKRDIHKHLKDTDSLLAYVYSTEPMINAAPNEHLDFSLLAETEGSVSDQAQARTLSAKKQKQRLAAMEKLKIKRKESNAIKQKLVAPVTSSRYDDVFDKGLDWLERLDGPSIEGDQIKIKFDQSIWKSELRRNGKLS
jgi:hypothetical protein